jgi:hypothetical protein
MADPEEQTTVILDPEGVKEIQGIIRQLDNFLERLEPQEFRKYYIQVQRLEGTGLPVRSGRLVRSKLALLEYICLESDKRREALDLRTEIISILTELLPY